MAEMDLVIMDFIEKAKDLAANACWRAANFWALISIAESLNKLVVQQNSNTSEVTSEIELSGFLFRAPGFKSADRGFASREVARELLKEFKIERKW
jgi:hypothetical protein